MDFFFQIRLESKVSSKTRLTFCTTGILLRRLEYDPQLKSVTHILVDEVHERSEESDFLLLILRDLIKVRKDLNVILMSATLNADLFSSYFEKVPILEIPGNFGSFFFYFTPCSYFIITWQIGNLVYVYFRKNFSSRTILLRGHYGTYKLRDGRKWSLRTKT